MKFKGDAFYCCEVTLYMQTKLLHIESFLLHRVICVFCRWQNPLDEWMDF